MHDKSVIRLVGVNTSRTSRDALTAGSDELSARLARPGSVLGPEALRHLLHCNVSSASSSVYWYGSLVSWCLLL